MKEKFYRCAHCGNLVGMVHDSGVPMMCCGEKMKPLLPNTVDASNEKHLPSVTVDGCSVKIKVGAVAHPMLAEHHIEWVYVQTERGGRRITLSAGDEPEVSICLDGDKAVAVYAYCNLHGLWMTEL